LQLYSSSSGEVIKLLQGYPNPVRWDHSLCGSYKLLYDDVYSPMKAENNVSCKWEGAIFCNHRVYPPVASHLGQLSLPSLRGR